MTTCMVGWSHTPFGKLVDDDVESLIVRATREALADASLQASDVDEIFVGQFNGGFASQDFPASLVLQADDGFRFKPATRVEDACATGSAAIYQGLNSIAAGRARIVLVVGVEKMYATPGERVGEILMSCSYLKDEEGPRQSGFPGIFARIAESYFAQHGDQSDALARIAAKNHKNGATNPLAQLRKDLGYDFCRQVSEKNPVPSQTRRDMTRFEGQKRAWEEAFVQAGVTLDDLSVDRRGTIQGPGEAPVRSSGRR